MTRKDRILKAIDTSGGYIGLELGPLTTPILTKQEANIKYADHLSLADLKKKYKTEPVVLKDIVAPDYVLGGQSLKSAVGRKKFDYIIASHVIEHIPDIVSWLNELTAILKPGGVISLVIPDKRFIFDINRRTSSVAEVMGAYYDKYERFSSAMMYDFASNCLKDVDTAKAWQDPDQYINAKRRWNQKDIDDKIRRNLDPKHYEDCHCYVFTPHSFVDILRALMEQQLIDLEVAYFLETQEYELEFYVSLRKIPRTSTSRNKQLRSLPKLPPERDKVKELEEQVAVLQQEIHALTHSVSWQVTRGLRAIRGIRKRGDRL